VILAAAVFKRYLRIIGQTDGQTNAGENLTSATAVGVGNQPLLKISV